MRAFNAWLHVPQPKLQIIGRVIAMLHNASLLWVVLSTPLRFTLFLILIRIDDIEDNSQLRRGRPGTSLRSTPPFQDSFLVKLRTKFMVSHRPSTLLTMFTSWPFKRSSPLKRKDTGMMMPKIDYSPKATWTKL